MVHEFSQLIDERDVIYKGAAYLRYLKKYI